MVVATLHDEAEPGAAPAEPIVRLRNVSKSYGALRAVHPLDLDIRARDFLAILGPSGCGKTTLLRLIGGFVEASTGTIAVDGVDVTRAGPERRPTNMVFQGYGLFPHMNVRRNVGYGLRTAKRPRDEVEERVDAALRLVRVAELADRPIDRLSGGQQQRVALARALVMRPRVLLLDEPFAALDLKLRQAMQEEVRRLHKETGGTFVFVTHDQSEAMGLATRIAVMNEGRLVQEGDAEALYTRPVSRFVATFIGEANTLAGERRAGRVTLRAGPTFPSPGADGAVTVVLRPEAMRLEPDDGGAEPTAAGRIEDAVFLGPFVRYAVRLDGGERITVHGPTRTDAALGPGRAARVGWRRADQRVLDDADTGGDANTNREREP